MSKKVMSEIPKLMTMRRTKRRSKIAVMRNPSYEPCPYFLNFASYTQIHSSPRASYTTRLLIPSISN
jgi:hypothetical protein